MRYLLGTATREEPHGSRQRSSGPRRPARGPVPAAQRRAGGALQRHRAADGAAFGLPAPGRLRRRRLCRQPAPRRGAGRTGLSLLARPAGGAGACLRSGRHPAGDGGGRRMRRDRGQGRHRVGRRLRRDRAGGRGDAGYPGRDRAGGGNAAPWPQFDGAGRPAQRRLDHHQCGLHRAGAACLQGRRAPVAKRLDDGRVDLAGEAAGAGVLEVGRGR